MEKLKLGQKVTATKKYVRVTTGKRKIWTAIEIKPIVGIVTGVRTLQDVIVDDDIWACEPYHYKRAYFVTFDINRNSIKIPEYAIFKI